MSCGLTSSSSSSCILPGGVVCTTSWSWFSRSPLCTDSGWCLTAAAGEVNTPYRTEQNRGNRIRHSLMQSTCVIRKQHSCPFWPLLQHPPSTHHTQVFHFRIDTHTDALSTHTHTHLTPHLLQPACDTHTHTHALTYSQNLPAPPPPTQIFIACLWHTIHMPCPKQITSPTPPPPSWQPACDTHTTLMPWPTQSTPPPPPPISIACLWHPCNIHVLPYRETPPPPHTHTHNLYSLPVIPTQNSCPALQSAPHPHPPSHPKTSTACLWHPHNTHSLLYNPPPPPTTTTPISTACLCDTHTTLMPCPTQTPPPPTPPQSL